MKNCIKNKIHTILKPYLKKFLLAFVLLIISTALSFPIPLLTRQLINSILHTGTYFSWSFSTYIVLLFSTLIMKEFISTYSVSLFETIVRIIAAQVRKSLFEILQYNYERLPFQETGRILTYIAQDTERIKHFVYPTFVNFLKDILTLIFALLVGIYLNIFVTLASLLPLISFFFLIKFINPKVRKLSEGLIESQTEFVSRLKEFIEALEMFRVSLKERFSINLFKNVNTSYTRHDIKRIRTIVLFNLPLSILFHSGYLVALILGAYLVSHGRMEIGTLFAVLMVVGYIYDSSRHLWDFNVHKEELKVVINRLKSIINLSCIEGTPAVIYSIKRIKNLSVRVSSFAYQSNHTILKEIEINAEAGDIIGIVGKSGIGKTTLIKIILGLLARGRKFVMVNDIPLTEINLNSYYKRLAYLPQQNIIFKGTVKENILLGEGKIKDARILDILDGIPLSKEIEEMGKNLSGGEKRRIAIARAFVHEDKDMYLLDEPFVHLDAKNVNKIKELIKARSKNSLIILVSHSTTIINELCNHIILLS